MSSKNPESTTARYRRKLLDIRIIAVLVILASIVVGLAAFAGSAKKLLALGHVFWRPSVVARLTVSSLSANDGTDTGGQILEISFTDIPEDFHVARVKLKAKVNSAEIAISGNPSEQVKAVAVDCVLHGDKLIAGSEEAWVDLDLYRKKGEPYSRANIRLAYDNQSSQIKLSIEPEYYDELGSLLKIRNDPPFILLTLTNRVTRIYEKKQ
jgi:hypothetical protein